MKVEERFYKASIPSVPSSNNNDDNYYVLKNNEWVTIDIDVDAGEVTLDYHTT